jgi:hypothetical protein
MMIIINAVVAGDFFVGLMQVRDRYFLYCGDIACVGIAVKSSDCGDSA